MFVEFVYALLFAITLIGAIMVVVSPHAVYNALYLVLTMVGIACIFVLMNAQLAAALQIIVYAGAIMVLFLFVIMLLNVGRQAPIASPGGKTIRALGVLLVAAFLLQMFALFARFTDPAAMGLSLADPESIDVQSIAVMLLTDYLYAFEMTSVLLLIAVIGAVVLARRRFIQGVDTSSRNIME